MNEVEVVQATESAVVLIPRGEHDASNEVELDLLLQEAIADHELVIVDVGEVEFIDSSFLHNLVRGQRAARARGSRLVLQMGTAPNVRRLLEMSGLLEELECADSRGEALEEAAA